VISDLARLGKLPQRPAPHLSSPHLEPGPRMPAAFSTTAHIGGPFLAAVTNVFCAAVIFNRNPIHVLFARWEINAFWIAAIGSGEAALFNAMIATIVANLSAI